MASNLALDTLFYRLSETDFLPALTVCDVDIRVSTIIRISCLAR